MALKDTSRLVSHALSQTKQIVEADTEVSTVDLSLLGNLNTNQFLNYIKLELLLEATELESKRAVALKEEFDLLVEELLKIEEQVDTLTEVTLELKLWMKEIELRARGKI